MIAVTKKRLIIHDQRIDRPEARHRRREKTAIGADRKFAGVLRWRRIDLKRVIAEWFGVDYHARHVGKLLKKLGFSHMSARPRHPSQDERIVETFKKRARVGGLRVETGCAIVNRRVSGRKVFGGADPVKKRGPWAVAGTCEW
jgi:Winged helix-turn helix